VIDGIDQATFSQADADVILAAYRVGRHVMTDPLGRRDRIEAWWDEDGPPVNTNLSNEVRSFEWPQGPALTWPRT
jgi:hypothetical protein